MEDRGSDHLSIIDPQSSILYPQPFLVVAAALAIAQSRLNSVGLDSPRLEAEVLMMHVLGWTRAQLYAHPKHTLTAVQSRRFERLVELRAHRKPLAYLTGHNEFFGLDFYVDPRVLIPRPETELLVEKALEMASARSIESLADVGTGSGAIAVALAVHLPTAKVYATDASVRALQVAQKNAARHRVEDRVEFLWGDLLQPLPAPVDLIVANLPYIPTSEIATLAPEIRDYEPLTALDGGPDGLDAIRRLLDQAPAYLNPGGAVLLEIGHNQGPAVADLARSAFPGGTATILPDYAGQDRIAVVNWERH